MKKKIFVFELVLFFVLLFSCKKDSEEKLNPNQDNDIEHHYPVIQIDSISNILLHTAEIHGTFINGGGDSILRIGYCVGLNSGIEIGETNLMLSDTIDFNHKLSNLEAGKQYFVKGFAYNSFDTSYTNEISFILWDGKLTDFDGNEYKGVQIGNQAWMAENLRTTHYKDGTPVFKEPYWYGTGYRPSYWDGDLDGDGDGDTEDSTIYVEKYGQLYTWTSANNLYFDGYNDLGGTPITLMANDVCPDGWHLPSQNEFEELVSFVRSEHSYSEVAHMLKSKEGWFENNNGSDFYGFNLKPGGGWEDPNGSGLSYKAYLWSSTEGNSVNAIGYRIYYEYNNLDDIFVGKESHAFAVRCVKDLETVIAP